MRVTPGALPESYIATRSLSVDACHALEPDDFGLQAAAFTSPPKWHLAHTTWFFETFLLKPFLPAYKPVHPQYEVLFNSYYQGVGEQFPRPQRGLLSRPTVAEVLDYREWVDTAMLELLADQGSPHREQVLERCTLGLQHEQQHQELFFTDLKYSLSINPLFPAYAAPDTEPAGGGGAPLRWLEVEGGLVETGYAGAGFCFDNELPRHKTWLEPFSIANRLLTNAEYQAFVDDGGYRNPSLWLADGWDQLCAHNWRQPLNWRDSADGGMEYTLYGLRPRRPEQPACHLSGYEAEAYARWAGARLPDEAEWEQAATSLPHAQAPIVANTYHPQAAADAPGLLQLDSDCWQWTRSAYGPYPGFTIAEGAVGEYNGKFMSNQWVLRGGSCVTPRGHPRPSYRNFFYPQDRWQFSGVRLAR